MQFEANLANNQVMEMIGNLSCQLAAHQLALVEANGYIAQLEAEKQALEDKLALLEFRKGDVNGRVEMEELSSGRDAG